MVESTDHALRALAPRQDMTGAERQWAGRYNSDDILRYSRGSATLGIESGSYTRAVATDPVANILTVEKTTGEPVTYDPKRLTGVSVYHEMKKDFSAGDRIQFNAPDKQLGVSYRELETIHRTSDDGLLSLRLDCGRQIDFDSTRIRGYDHGYAVTSHSAQGLTTDRVLIDIDTGTQPDLINSRFAYVSVSRARLEAKIYTNDISTLTRNLSNDISKSSAIEFIQAMRHLRPSLCRAKKLECGVYFPCNWLPGD